MLSEIIAIISPIFIAAAIGFGWARSGVDYPSDFIGRMVMNIALPCLLISTLSHSEVQLAALLKMGLACLIASALMLMMALLVLRLKKLNPREWLNSLLFANTGNMGLPLTLFAFGEEGLALSLGWFTGMMLLQFTLGNAVVSRASGLHQAKELLTKPAIWGVIIGTTLLASGQRLPLGLDRTAGLLGQISIPLMMITLGVSIAQLKAPLLKTPIALSMVRIGGGLACGYAAASMLGLQGTALGVVLLQSAMPVAVFNYLLALHHQRAAAEVASMVLVSTLMALPLLPVLVTIARRAAAL